MKRRVRLGGQVYDLDRLSAGQRHWVDMVGFIDQRIGDLCQTLALVDQAKRNHRDVLEREIIKARAGVDLSSLLSD